MSTIHKPPEEFYEDYPSLWEYYPCFVLKNMGDLDIYVDSDKIYINHTCAPYPYAYIKYGSDHTWDKNDYDFDISYYSSGRVSVGKVYINPGEEKQFDIDGKYDDLSFWYDSNNRYLEISVQDVEGNVFASKGRIFPAVSSSSDGSDSDYGGAGNDIDLSEFVFCLASLLILFIFIIIGALYWDKKKKEQKLREEEQERIAKETAEKLRAEQEKLTEKLRAEKQEKTEKTKKKVKKKAVAWDFILKFAEKYRVNWHYAELEKLNELLKTKYSLNLDENILVLLIREAVDELDEKKRKQEYEHFKKTILMEKPKTKVDYVDALLKRYGEDYDKYKFYFEDLMKEKDIEVDSFSLDTLINERRRKIEIDSFEKALVKGEAKEEVDLDFMSGYEFEQFLGNLFKKMGYNVINTKLSGDQGADLIVERFGEKTVVQAKNYSGSVGNKAIQEALTAREYYKCNKAIVVTTSYFTRQAIDAAKKTKVELWDRNKLDEVITRYSGTDTNHENEEDIEIDDGITTVCKICGVNETSNPNGISDTMNSKEKEEIEKAIFAEKLLQNALEEELEKEYAYPKVMDLFERAELITIINNHSDLSKI